MVRVKNTQGQACAAYSAFGPVMDRYRCRDLDLPIEHVPISGPGVDALERRKETNNSHNVTATELRASFIRVQDALYSGLKALNKAACMPES